MGVDGHKVTLADFGGKVVVISFWATWCSPCRKELPILEGIQKAGKGQIQVSAGGGQTNVSSIELRDTDFTSVNFHDYLLVGTNVAAVTMAVTITRSAATPAKRSPAKNSYVTPPAPQERHGVRRR